MWAQAHRGCLPDSRYRRDHGVVDLVVPVASGRCDGGQPRPWEVDRAATLRPSLARWTLACRRRRPGCSAGLRRALWTQGRELVVPRRRLCVRPCSAWGASWVDSVAAGGGWPHHGTLAGLAAASEAGPTGGTTRGYPPGYAENTADTALCRSLARWRSGSQAASPGSPAVGLSAALSMKEDAGRSSTSPGSSGGHLLSSSVGGRQAVTARPSGGIGAAAAGTEEIFVFGGL